MIDAIVSRIPLSVKMQYGLKALGVDSTEQQTLDSLIARLGTNPVVATVLGQEVVSLPSLVDTVQQWMSTDADKLALGLPTIKRILSNEKGRDMISQIVLDTIAKSPEKDSLIGVIDKVSKAPLPGFGDTEYPDIRTFLNEGALPLLMGMLPETPQDVIGALVKCPYCSETHIHHIGD